MPSTTLRLPLFITLVMLLGADLAYSAYRGRADLVGWPEILIVILLVVVGVGQRFTRVVVGEVLTIEQQVEEFKEEVRAIRRLAGTRDTAALEELLNRATRLPSEAWLKLIFYRLVLRALLRREASKLRVTLRSDTSISYMLGELYRNGVVTDDLREGIDFLREVTYAAEWGAGRFPSDEEVQRGLEEAPQILRQLDAISGYGA